MIKTIYMCDRCGCDINQGEEAAVLGHDLCPDCMEDLGQMVDDWMKTRKKIDWGKAQALRDAGWSLEQIGTEIGAPKTTVCRHTKPPKKRKKYDLEWREQEPDLIKSPDLI